LAAGLRTLENRTAYAASGSDYINPPRSALPKSKDAHSADAKQQQPEAGI